MPQKTISLCMIVGDFENPTMLEDCIKSTNKIINSIYIIFNYKLFPFGNNKYPFKFRHILKNEKIKGTKYVKWKNFSDARNKSLEMANTGTDDYIMWLDCDDRLVNPQEVVDVLELNPAMDAFQCVIMAINERGGHERLTQTRIFRNNPLYKFQNAAHEDLVFSLNQNGAVCAKTNIVISHIGYKNSKKTEQSNIRNYKLLLTDFKKPTAHALTYFGLINCLLLLHGNKKTKKRNYIKAIKMIDETLKKFKLTDNDPLTKKLWSIRGSACIRCNQMLAAKQSLHKAFDEWQYPEAAVNLAEIYMQERNWDKAIQILEVLYNKKGFETGNIPFDIIEVEFLMYQKLGDCWFNKINPDKVETHSRAIREAEKYYRLALILSPGNVMVIDKLAHILRNTNRTSESALLTLQAVNRNPHYSVGWSNLGQYELSYKRYESAMVFFREAFKYDSKNEIALHNLKTLEGIKKTYQGRIKK